MLDEDEKQSMQQCIEEFTKEKRQARRWGMFFKFSLLAVIIIAIGMGGYENAGGKEEEHTALIKLEGVIFSESDSSSYSINKRLREAFENEQAKAIILEINTPGGSPVQSAQINEEITRLRALYKEKPIYATIGDICASGGMFVAVATDAIYANRASLIGSIGVIMGGFGFEKFIDKVGIERRLLTAGKHKAMLDPFLPENPQEKAHAQKLLDELHAYFIQVVEEGRANKLPKERGDLYSGLIWSGDKSKELGLIDGFGDAHYVAREIIKEDNIVEYKPIRDWDTILQTFGADMLFSVITKLSVYPRFF